MSDAIDQSTSRENGGVSYVKSAPIFFLFLKCINFEWIPLFPLVSDCWDSRGDSRRHFLRWRECPAGSGGGGGGLRFTGSSRK